MTSQDLKRWRDAKFRDGKKILRSTHSNRSCAAARKEHQPSLPPQLTVNVDRSAESPIAFALEYCNGNKSNRLIFFSGVKQMAALNLPTQATYEVHEHVKVDTTGMLHVARNE
jgi:hypothetical protein